MIKKFLLFKFTIKKDKTLLLGMTVVLIFICTTAMITFSCINTKSIKLTESMIFSLLVTVYLIGEFFSDFNRSLLYILKENINKENYLIYDRDRFLEIIKNYIMMEESKNER